MVESIPRDNKQGGILASFKRRPKAWLFLGLPAVAVLAVVILIGFAGVFQIALKHAETNQFCVSCHEMKIPEQEYMRSTHFTNQFGARAGCSNCHVPPTFFRGLIRHAKASVEVYESLRGELDTPAKYETHRLELAQSVWRELKANDSAECRSCHTPDAMALAQQPASAAAAHASLATNRGETCIDCHKGLVHALPPDS
jgi:nitrate/TMAO reductase-like tetraheme cytochrome c subunit